MENIQTEASYKNGVLVEYGTKGSVRFDVILLEKDVPVAAWDFKTGTAVLSNSRIMTMQTVSGFPNLPIHALYGR